MVSRAPSWRTWPRLPSRATAWHRYPRYTAGSVGGSLKQPGSTDIQGILLGVSGVLVAYALQMLTTMKWGTLSVTVLVKLYCYCSLSIHELTISSSNLDNQAR